MIGSGRSQRRRRHEPHLGLTERDQRQVALDRLVADPEIGVTGRHELVHLMGTAAAEEPGVQGDALLAQRGQERQGHRRLQRGGRGHDDLRVAPTASPGRSFSASMLRSARRAPGTNTSPSGVSSTPRPALANSATPSSRSSRRTARLRAGWATNSAAAAAVMLPWSTVATTYLSCWMFTPPPKSQSCPTGLGRGYPTESTLEHMRPIIVQARALVAGLVALVVLTAAAPAAHADTTAPTGATHRRTQGPADQRRQRPRSRRGLRHRRQGALRAPQGAVRRGRRRAGRRAVLAAERRRRPDDHARASARCRSPSRR